MRKPRVVPKKFTFTSDDIVAMKESAVFLKAWMQKIDDRLFREGYELRDGILFEVKTNKLISFEEYQKRRKDLRS